MDLDQFYGTLNQAAQCEFQQGTLVDAIDRMALDNGDKVAVVSGEAFQSYQQLKARSDQVAAYLIAQGVGAGSLVGVCCNRDVNTPAILLGVMKSGAGYVPLDPAYPIERLSYMAEDSAIEHVLAHEQQAELVNQFKVAQTIIDETTFWQDQAGDQANKQKRILPSINSESTAYVIYTSGSTGKPKGVLVPHGSVINMLWSLVEWPGFTAQDRILATTTLSFDISVAEMFLPLIVGGSVAIVDRATAKDSNALVDSIDRYQVTFVQATPAMWRMIVETTFQGRKDLKFVTAGEPLPRDLIQPLLDRCGELWNLYGPTETTVYSSGTQIHNDSDRILIGRPIANTKIFIVDKNDQLCQPEVAGELLIGGAGMTLGYLNRPELNSKKFIQWNGQSVYRTGDLAKLTADGQIDHLGRIDGQIKLNGHRIELGEIDAAMAMQPNVRRAATVLREDRPGDQRLIGYLLANNAQPDTARIRSALGQTLPDYMVPNQIVVVEKFPYTGSGKLDRNAFPPPSTNRPELGVEYVAPTTAQEKQLSAIWSEILQIDSVGTDDNFFDLGGNSIAVVRVVAAMNEQVGLQISNADLFDRPTISGLLSIKAYADHTVGSKPKPSRKIGDKDNQEFAIVGMAARMPGAKNVAEFWQNLIDENESITFFQPDELDPTLPIEDTQASNYVSARGIIEDAEYFDSRFFRTPPKNADLTCPQQRIMLELAWTAMEDAGIRPTKTDPNYIGKVGVWAGTYATTYLNKNLLPNQEIVQETGEFQLGVYNEKDYIATRIAHALNLKGPAVNVNTACSTSLVALIEACKALDAGHCDAAIAGGASINFPQRSGHLHQTGSIFSPDGHCRPFDAKGAGTLFSDGAGVVVVKRLTDAIADGDRIYGVVKGFGINNDGGEKASFSAPSVQGQADAISMAQSMAGFEPDSIGYIEAHGTATPIGDPIEVQALRRVFEAKTDKKQFCAIGSVKSNIGHTVAAAGIAGLIKSVLALHHEKIPATLHFENPNPDIDFKQSPFYVCDSLLPWPRGDQPRRAGVSSFGVGGTNAHILVEESPRLPMQNHQVDNRPPVSILPLSAKNDDALKDATAELSSFLNENGSLAPAQVACSLQNRREHFAYRAMVVAGSPNEASELLSTKPPRRFYKRKASSSSRDVAFMFPGQGSQYVRMGQNFYDHSPVFRKYMDRCAEVLKPLLGRDLREVLYPTVGDEIASSEILKNTRFTQPALFSLGYSLAQLWISWGIEPKVLMGHSIGEFAASCVAGVFNLEDGLKMIAERGRAMEALPGGSMMSVGLPGVEVEPMLWGQMSVGSYNGPKLCVVAGPDDQVAMLQDKLQAQDIVCRHLHTSHAFHSPMMDEIVEPFARFISQFDLSAPKLPIISTVTGDLMTSQQATDPNYWAQHLRRPVRFSEAVTQIWSPDESPNGWTGDPNLILVELGPRWTLSTLAKQHATDLKQQIALPTLSSSADSNEEWIAAMNAVGQLWLTGYPVDWSRLSVDGEGLAKLPHLTLPTYPFQRKRHFIDPLPRSWQDTGIRIDNSLPKSQPSQVVDEAANISQPFTTTSTPKSKIKAKPMSRNLTLVAKISSVFENTSGFDLSEFEGDTTFFEMGLDSLVLTQTATALKKEFDFEITFRQLLEDTPSVDSLAEWLDQNLPADRYAEIETSSQTESPAAPTPHVLPEAGDIVDNPTAQSNPVAPQSQAPVIAGLPANSNPMVNFDGHGLQAVVQNQLQLMSAQLQLLSGAAMPATPVQLTTGATAAASVSVSPPPTAQESVATPAEGGLVDQKKVETDKNEMSTKAKRFSTVKKNDSRLDASQQAALNEMIRMNNAMMPGSKQYAQQHRKYMADPRTVSGFRPNMKEMTHPIVVERSKGVQLWDIDGNEYVDFTCGFGSNILGHTHPITIKAITQQVQTDFAIGPQSPLAGEVAELFCELTGHERMAFSNTGSEAVLGCTRLARNATGRDLVVMFNGDYHGILDEVIARGSKKLNSFPAATGIPKDHVSNTLILDYGDPKSLQIIRDRLDEIAAVLVEPVQSRMPELQPKEFLQSLREITENDPACLIFDEVISGFRIGLGGAQEHFGVKADLAAYGKIVGGGMPIGVVAGKAKYMDGLDGGFWQYGDDSRPEAGMTYFAGTFVRHPLTLAASKAILQHLKAGGKPMYDRLNQLGDYLAAQLNTVFETMEAPLFLGNFGSLFKIQFHQELVYSEVFFAGLRRRGMHIWDNRPCLLTLAHEKSHVDQLVVAMRETIAECQRFGFMPGQGFKKISSQLDVNCPPQAGAKVGKDRKGNPGWFVPDASNPGQFIQVGLPLN